MVNDKNNNAVCPRKSDTYETHKLVLLHFKYKTDILFLWCTGEQKYNNIRMNDFAIQ